MGGELAQRRDAQDAPDRPGPGADRHSAGPQEPVEPQLVRKGQRRLAGLDEKIIALYAGGMTTREIETCISELYGPGVSRETVSRVTAAVLEDAKAWQTRPLEQIYPIVHLDALVIKIRDGQAVRNFACYLAIGVNLDGDRDVLGMWFQRTEGAKFWLAVLTDLKTRGVQDVLVCCVDGLTGFPEAIEAVYPQAWVQTCLVHVVRSSLRFVPYKDKKKVAADLKKIYTAVDRDHAESELERFAETWDAKYPMISASWIENGACGGVREELGRIPASLPRVRACWPGACAGQLQCPRVRARVSADPVRAGGCVLRSRARGVRERGGGRDRLNPAWLTAR